MRLSLFQRQAIREAVETTFGPEARVFLFGSRTNDNKRGGDIDLLVEVPASLNDSMTKTVRTVGTIQRKIGDQKIDLVVTDGSPERENELIVKNARTQGILL